MGWDDAENQFCPDGLLQRDLLQRESSQNKFQVQERHNFLQNARLGRHSAKRISFTECFFRAVNSSFQGHDERRHVSYTLASGRHSIGC